MSYEFLVKSIDRENLILPESTTINRFLLKNNEHEILKAVDFFASDEKFMHIHGFLGTGKRQFIKYICNFIDSNVIKLEYFCKAATVCDDILLSFIKQLEGLTMSKAVNINSKISTLSFKFFQYISSIHKPFVIILHSFDDIEDQNIKVVTDSLNAILAKNNVRVIISTRAMQPTILHDLQDDRKIFLKAFTKEIFKEFVEDCKIEVNDKILDNFYKYTRGYYYYTALAIKIIQAMKIDVNEFLQKFLYSGMSFDAYLGVTYVNLIPTTIRNFFWFLRTIRHGLTLNALAVFEIYDEFSIEFLKTNLMVFQDEETIYVQDFFLQKIDISIPAKTEIKLHKYIIGMYEKQLKENLQERVIKISRQAMRSEINYHNKCIENIESPQANKNISDEELLENASNTVKVQDDKSEGLTQDNIKKLIVEKKYTEAMECCQQILNQENVELLTVINIRLTLAKIYKEIAEYQNAINYYELVEIYYKQHNEVINLNYLYYDMTDLYFRMYKHDRAIETIKKVIYSVDTPQSLMVKSCILLGNIYSAINNPDEAFNYYQKALESLNENVSINILAELYFKYALACDDKNDTNLSFEYYNRCINLKGENLYKASAYANLASCYYENNSLDDAKFCFKQAYEIEQDNNNYEGIYYTALHLAKILIKENNNDKALEYLLKAQKSAEFVNEDLYILESSIALGDYYYNIPSKMSEALTEYFKAYKIADRIDADNLNIIQRRINDMKYRMSKEDFEKIEKKYAR